MLQPVGAGTEPDDVIRAFEEMALDDDVELPVDDAIRGLAVLLVNPETQGKERAVLTQVGGTLYRVGLNERVIEVVKKRVQ